MGLVHKVVRTCYRPGCGARIDVTTRNGRLVETVVECHCPPRVEPKPEPKPKPRPPRVCEDCDVTVSPYARWCPTHGPLHRRKRVRDWMRKKHGYQPAKRRPA